MAEGLQGLLRSAQEGPEDRSSPEVSMVPRGGFPSPTLGLCALFTCPLGKPPADRVSLNRAPSRSVERMNSLTAHARHPNSELNRRHRRRSLDGRRELPQRCLRLLSVGRCCHRALPRIRPVPSSARSEHPTKSARRTCVLRRATLETPLCPCSLSEQLVILVVLALHSGDQGRMGQRKGTGEHNE